MNAVFATGRNEVQRTLRRRMAITYNDLFLDIRRELKQGGVIDTTLEARELTCFGVNKTREELTRDGRLYAPPELERRVRELTARHLAGEPVAYLIGEWEFYGLPLDISKEVLIPRPDTEVLVDQALPYVQSLGNCRVLDLCAGSGCIGLALASQAPQAHVVLGEFSDGALRICRQNTRRNALTGRVIPMTVNALERPDRALGEFHCIVSNPPYIPHGDIPGLDHSVKDYEPHLALDGGEDGLDFYRAISEKWKAALAPGGRLYFEVGIGQADAVLRIMRAQGFGDIQVVKDHNDIPRVVFGTPVSYTHLEDGRFTLQLEEMDLQAEFEDAIFTYRELFRQEGIELRYEPGEEILPPISGDPERLKQVFCNVLDNAAKHGGAGRRIDASLTREGTNQVVRVRDYGPGVPAAELPYVKQKFYKGSSKARGSGIGLAVCDEIVRLHGGTFDIANAEGGGAVVTICIPEKE